MENPFKYGGVVRGPYFSDRKSEIEALKREMVNLNHVFLVSPRRFGKTCLLLNLIETLKHDAMACAYIDLNAFPDIRSFAGALASLTTEALETTRINFLKCFQGFKSFVQRLPVIIARQDSPHYEMLWRSASQPQKMLLIALSKDQTAKPFSKDFQLKHGIGPFPHHQSKRPLILL